MILKLTFKSKSSNETYAVFIKQYEILKALTNIQPVLIKPEKILQLIITIAMAAPTMFFGRNTPRIRNTWQENTLCCLSAIFLDAQTISLDHYPGRRVYFSFDHYESLTINAIFIAKRIRMKAKEKL